MNRSEKLVQTRLRETLQTLDLPASITIENVDEPVRVQNQESQPDIQEEQDGSHSEA